MGRDREKEGEIEGRREKRWRDREEGKVGGEIDGRREK